MAGVLKWAKSLDIPRTDCFPDSLLGFQQELNSTDRLNDSMTTSSYTSLMHKSAQDCSLERKDFLPRE